MSADANNNREQTITCLLHALQQVQATVRAYDTKAQIVGIAFIFTVGIVQLLIPDALVSQFSAEAPMLRFLVGFALLMSPLAVFGAVLYPRYNPLDDRQSNNAAVYSFRTTNQQTLDDYLRDIDEVDWKRELAIEITAVSRIREVKRRRFVLALYMTGASYLVVFTLVVIALARGA